MRRFAAVLLWSIGALLAGAAIAGVEAPAPQAPPRQAPMAAPHGAPAPAAATAPGAAADDERAPVPVPVASEIAMRHYRTGNLWWLWDNAWGLLAPLVLLLSGMSARLRTFAARIGRGRFATIALYGVLFTLLVAALDLPFAWLETYARPHAYGLSEQTAAKWWQDQAIGTALGCGFLACTLWFPYWLLRRSPRRWWLYTGLASAPLLALLLFVAPIWIDPLFNDFGPMQDKQLEHDILTLASRAGIAGGSVYEVKKSVDTNTVNAYVAGFLDTKRIVLWDTILRKLDRREILLVMGHEMGHYVLGHVPQLIALGAALVLVGLWVVHRAAGGLIARFHDRFGFDELADVASLPLVLVLLSLVGLLLAPAVNAFGRHTEHEADRFGLEITRDNHACAMAFVKLQRENLSNPRPGLLYKLWRSDHPPLGERIDFCNDYRPWETGAPLRYGALFRP